MNTSAQRAVLFAAWLALTGAAGAQQTPTTPPAFEPVPEPPAGAQIGADEPIITIRRQEGAELKEYRVRGQLVAVKVTPRIGKPYWLIKRNGEMQRFDGPSPNLTVPSWLVLEW